MKLSIDTKARKIALDGKPLETVTDLSINQHHGEPAAQVTIRADLDVNFESEIFGEVFNEIYCPKCNFYIGKINAAGRIYGFKCPRCRSDIERITPSSKG